MYTTTARLTYAPLVIGQEQAFQAAQQILSGKPKPTAIVCANDIMASVPSVLSNQLVWKSEQTFPAPGMTILQLPN